VEEGVISDGAETNAGPVAISGIVGPARFFERGRAYRP
jgi:hypothetical protein